MRSFTIVLILAICAPAVLCDDDGSLLYYFSWIQPSVSTSEPSKSSSNEDTIKIEFPSSDVYYDSDQSAPVQFKTDSKTDTTATKTEEETASESSKLSTYTTSIDETTQQALVENEFWKHFMAILLNVEKELSGPIEEQPIEGPPNKAELNKNTGKKYNPNDSKKSRQIFKAENLNKRVAYVESFESSPSSSEWDSTSDQSSSENSEESSEENSRECSEDCSEDDTFQSSNVSSESSNDSSKRTNSEASTQTFESYFDSEWSSDFEERFIVPLEPYPDDYDSTSYIVEESDEKIPDKTEDTLPRTQASTKEENIPSVASSETVFESTKEDKEQESSISEPSTDNSQVSNDKINDEENQRIAEIQSSTTSNAKEENVEITSSNDETVDDVSTKTKNTESTTEDKAESTDDKNNEIDNEIEEKPYDDKPLGHISFGQFMKAFVKRMFVL